MKNSIKTANVLEKMKQSSADVHREICNMINIIIIISDALKVMKDTVCLLEQSDEIRKNLECITSELYSVYYTIKCMLEEYDELSDLLREYERQNNSYACAKLNELFTEESETEKAIDAAPAYVDISNHINESYDDFLILDDEVPF